MLGNGRPSAFTSDHYCMQIALLGSDGIHCQCRYRDYHVALEADFCCCTVVHSRAKRGTPVFLVVRGDVNYVHRS